MDYLINLINVLMNWINSSQKKHKCQEVLVTCSMYLANRKQKLKQFLDSIFY